MLSFHLEWKFCAIVHTHSANSVCIVYIWWFAASLFGPFSTKSSISYEIYAIDIIVCMWQNTPHHTNILLLHTLWLGIQCGSAPVQSWKMNWHIETMSGEESEWKKKHTQHTKKYKNIAHDVNTTRAQKAQLRAIRLCLHWALRYTLLLIAWKCDETEFWSTKNTWRHIFASR